MTATVYHNHLPIYRVVRRSWHDPTEVAFSQGSKADNRWNTVAFPALYCCCSEAVASAVVRDIFRITGAGLADLLEAAYPQLVELDWEGEAVDMTTEAAIVSLGFATDYPVGIDHVQTRILAVSWHAGGASAVLCRSASLSRIGFSGWIGDHAAWSELAIYTVNSPKKPVVLRRRNDLGWL